MRHLFFICILTLLSLIPVAHAASSAAPQAGVTDYYVPLVGLPFVTSSQPDFQSLVNAFYKVAISVAAFLAVGKIVIAGVKYMMTDVVSAKGKARDDIRAAIVGLLIVIGAVLILNTINPQLTNLAVLKNAPIPNVAERGMTAPATGPTTCPAGQTFTVTTQAPAGKCVTSNTYVVKTSGCKTQQQCNAACATQIGPTSVYDPTTHSCTQSTKIVQISQTTYNKWVKLANGNSSFITIQGKQYCSTNYPNTTPNYDPKNHTCVPTGGQ